jgi:hypothetical protein
MKGVTFHVTKKAKWTRAGDSDRTFFLQTADGEHKRHGWKGAKLGSQSLKVTHVTSGRVQGWGAETTGHVQLVDASDRVFWILMYSKMEREQEIYWVPRPPAGAKAAQAALVQ